MSTAALSQVTEPSGRQAPVFRPMRFSDYAAVRALLADHGMGMPSFEHWSSRWIANRHWHNLGHEPPIGWVLVAATGEIVGSIETIPLLYKFRGTNLIAAVSRAWCVKSGYRGYALQLIDEYFSQDVDVFISTTVGSAAVSTLSQFYGPIPLGRWDRMSYFVTDHVRFAKRALRKYQVPLASLLAHPTAWSLRLKDALSGAAPTQTPSAVEIETTTSFDTRFDAFWRELIHENPGKLLAERSSRALAWHFGSDLQSNRLWILTASSMGRMRGYCILRKDCGTDGGAKVVLIDYQNLDPQCDLLSDFLREALKRCAAERFYALQNFGIGVPKMRAFDEHAPYCRKLPNAIFYFGATNAALGAELREPQSWDPSLYDGDATL